MKNLGIVAILIYIGANSITPANSDTVGTNDNGDEIIPIGVLERVNTNAKTMEEAIILSQMRQATLELEAPERTYNGIATFLWNEGFNLRDLGVYMRLLRGAIAESRLENSSQRLSNNW